MFDSSPSCCSILDDDDDDDDGWEKFVSISIHFHLFEVWSAARSFIKDGEGDNNQQHVMRDAPQAFRMKTEQFAQVFHPLKSALGFLQFLTHISFAFY